MTLDIICPSMGGHERAVESWLATARMPDDLFVQVLDKTEGEDAGFLTKLQKGYEIATGDIIGYLHSDVIIHEPGWPARVLREFEAPDVAVVGFFGAKTLGHPDIFRVPYSFKQLARGRCLSNLTDAEQHGERSAGPSDVAVIDSFAVFVRRDFLTRVGGWQTSGLPNSSHCTDLWICAMAHRLGQRVRFVGVSCTHASGGKGDAGTRWLDERGGDDTMHKRAHRVIYEQFRDVLPWSVR